IFSIAIPVTTPASSFGTGSMLLSMERRIALRICSSETAITYLLLATHKVMPLGFQYRDRPPNRVPFVVVEASGPTHSCRFLLCDALSQILFTLPERFDHLAGDPWLPDTILRRHQSS